MNKDIESTEDRIKYHNKITGAYYDTNVTSMVGNFVGEDGVLYFSFMVVDPVFGKIKHDMSAEKIIYYVDRVLKPKLKKLQRTKEKV
jgi:hypothetical protein